VESLEQSLENEKAVLQKLLQKILIYRLTRNIDKELEDRKISHLELSENTGRNSNWFNRTYNELEDMKTSTFIKVITAINKIISDNDNFKPVEVNSVLNEEILKMASVSIDLAMNEVDYLLKNDHDFCEFFVGMHFYVDALKALKNVLTEEELNVYEQLLNRIKA
jgi:DNA-binding transcriptional regulator YhcF (GntR family)